MRHKTYAQLTVFLLFLASCKKEDVKVFDEPFNRVYGGTQGDAAYAIAQGPENTVAFAGITTSNDGDVGGNHGNADAWVCAIDKKGNLLWQKALGGSNYDEANAIAAAADGGYIVAGNTRSDDGDVSGTHDVHGFPFDMWVVKVDRNGNKVWQKTLGGSSIDNALAITRSPEGGYVVAGYTQSNDGDVTGFQGQVDAWVVKLDRNGNKVWQKTYGGSAADYAYAIQPSRYGGYILAGQTQSNNGDVSGAHGGVDLWLFKIDESGNLQWQKSLGGSAHDYGRSVTESKDDGYTVAGYSGSNDGDVSGNHRVGSDDAWVISVDKFGNKRWQKTFGGSGGELALSIAGLQTGGIVVAGITRSADGDVSGFRGAEDAWLLLLDSNGNLLKQKTFGGSRDDAATAIIALNPKQFIIAGYSSSNDGDVSGNHGSGDAWVISTKSS